MPRSLVTLKIFSNSARSNTAPEGFDGELIITSLVFGVMARSIIAAVKVNPAASSVSTNTHFAPA